jgi:Rv2632c-like
MSDYKHWIVDIYIEPEDLERTTHAVARLHRDYEEQYCLEGEGHAQRMVGDQPVEAIGADLAVGRSLSALAHSLESMGAALQLHK